MAQFAKRIKRCEADRNKRARLQGTPERRAELDRMNQAGVKKESHAIGDGWRNGRTVKVKAKETKRKSAAQVQRNH